MNRKLFYKMFVAFYLLTVIVSVGTSKAFAALYHGGNHEDTHESDYYNNDGCSRGSSSRKKTDYTSSYMKVTTSSQCGVFGVDVIGTTTQSPLIYFIPNENICTQGTPKTINIGEAKYLPNLVKERGFGYCNLNFEIPYYGSCTIDFLWSPDSV